MMVSGVLRLNISAFYKLKWFMTDQLSRLQTTSLSVREVWGSIPGPFKSDAVSSALRCFFGAVLPLRKAAEVDPATRFGVIPRVS